MQPPEALVEARSVVRYGVPALRHQRAQLLGPILEQRQRLIPNDGLACLLLVELRVWVVAGEHLPNHDAEAPD